MRARLLPAPAGRAPSAGQGGDIASAFGGGSQTAFGARRGHGLTRATAVLGALFMIGAVVLTGARPAGIGSLLRGTAAPRPPVQAPAANPPSNPVQPAPTPQQQPTALPTDQPAPEQAKPGVAGTPQKPAGNEVRRPAVAGVTASEEHPAPRRVRSSTDSRRQSCAAGHRRSYAR